MANYADLAAFYTHGLSLVQCGGVSVERQQGCLDARNIGADDYLRGRYKLPLQTPYPLSFIQRICHLVAWDVWMIRGGNPIAGSDVNIPERGALALQWFEGVERQRIHPAFVETIGSSDPGYAAPLVLSKLPQGWLP